MDRCSIHSFCHSYSTTAGCETTKLRKIKEILMVPREADVCQLPEKPSLTCSMLLQNREKLQKFPNKFSNPE